MPAKIATLLACNRYHNVITTTYTPLTSNDSNFGSGKAHSGALRSVVTTLNQCSHHSIAASTCCIVAVVHHLQAYDARDVCQRQVIDFFKSQPN